jgi:hypothetical protein
MPKTFRVLLLAVASCLLTILVWSCSKKNPTTPNDTTGGGELSGSLATAGSQYAHTFTTAGTFNYKCAIHPSCASLAGTIVVLPPGGAIQHRVLSITQSGGSSGTYATCSSLSLQRDTVLVGDQVTWTNNSPLPHTVTSQ